MIISAKVFLYFSLADRGSEASHYRRDRFKGFINVMISFFTLLPLNDIDNYIKLLNNFDFSSKRNKNVHIPFDILDNNILRSN